MTGGLGGKGTVAVSAVFGMGVVLVAFMAVVGVRMPLVAWEDVFQALLGLPEQRMKAHDFECKSGRGRSQGRAMRGSWARKAETAGNVKSEGVR
jgi:hypothetical protein